MEGPQRLLGPFYRDLEDDEITIDPSQPGKLATLLVLTQMSSIGIFSWYFVCVQPPKPYDISDMTITASALLDDLNALPNAAIAVLVSGKDTHTGEKSVFGYYIPDAEFEEEQLLLFQLSPIQDAFAEIPPDLVVGWTEASWSLGRGEMVLHWCFSRT